MAKFLDECMDSADWVEEVTGYRPVDDVFTLKELDEMQKTDIFDDCCHWDYSLEETSMLATESDYNCNAYVLVRFSDEFGGYVYRWGECGER